MGVLSLSSTAFGGGLILYEIATPDLGLASAGYAARADDASTVFKNPAGMSMITNNQFQGGLQVLYGSVSFSPDANTSPGLGTEGGGNAIGWLPAGGLFVVVPVAEKWNVGLGTLSYFGLSEKYDDNWVGRYYVQNGTLIGMTIMPSVSFQATEWLSIGAGLNAMYGYLNTEMAVNIPLSPTDGQMSLKDHAWGVGANVGLLIKASEQTRFGVTYLSPVKLDFAATPTFAQFVPPSSSELDLGMTVPQSVMVSAYHELNERWAMMADFGWQNWSEFGYVQAGVEGGATTTLNLEYQDTFHGAVGAQYRGFEKWILSTGVAFDSSAVDDANRTVTVPMGQGWRFGLGAQYQLSEAVNLGAAYTFLWLGDMSVDQQSTLPVAVGGRGRVSGSNDDAWFSLFTVNLTWEF
jgi:long-chain fatty acid transport protein